MDQPTTKRRNRLSIKTPHSCSRWVLARQNAGDPAGVRRDNKNIVRRRGKLERPGGCPLPEKPLVNPIILHMPPPLHRLLLAAAPALAGSCAVLALAGVGKGLWVSHLSSIVLAGVLVALSLLGRGSQRPTLASRFVLAASLVVLALPLLVGDQDPKRWIAMGPWSLYVAPLVLPAFLLACSVRLREPGHTPALTIGAPLTATLLLAVQPDASQALALLAGSAVVFVAQRAMDWPRAAAFLAMSLTTAWAFSRPDPLEPVPYVEEVFALALSSSLPVGLAVILSAVALVAGLGLCSLQGHPGLAAVAAYYAVLFGCSVAGWTPAPLLGFGSGPILGFGMMVMVWRCLEPRQYLEPRQLG